MSQTKISQFPVLDLAHTDGNIILPVVAGVVNYKIAISTLLAFINGQSTLKGLSDVGIGTPSDGQYLLFDITSGKWHPVTVQGLKTTDSPTFSGLTLTAPVPTTITGKWGVTGATGSAGQQPILSNNSTFTISTVVNSGVTVLRILDATMYVDIDNMFNNLQVPAPSTAITAGPWSMGGLTVTWNGGASTLTIAKTSGVTYTAKPLVSLVSSELVDLNNTKLVNLVYPTNDNQPTSKLYVDNLVTARLVKSSNLADLPDKLGSRQNLGVTGFTGVFVLPNTQHVSVLDGLVKEIGISTITITSPVNGSTVNGGNGSISTSIAWSKAILPTDEVFLTVDAGSPIGPLNSPHNVVFNSIGSHSITLVSRWSSSITATSTFAVQIPSVSLAGEGGYPWPIYDIGSSFSPTWTTVGLNGVNGDIYVDGSLHSSGVASGAGIVDINDTGSIHNLYVVVGGIQSGTITYTTRAVGPQSITLAGDGSSFDLGGSFTPNWTVDYDSENCSLYYSANSTTPIGSGISGTITFTPNNTGQYQLYLISNVSGVQSNFITITVN